MGFRVGYGRGLGYGRGYGLGYGRGIGWRYSYYGLDLSRCVRFPWLPRWWWSNPSYARTYPTTTINRAAVPYPATDERAYLEDQMKYMEQELTAIKKRLDELKTA
jgi:hypothetical protein